MRGITLAGAIALASLSTVAHAGRGKPCDSCESCTEMLALPGAEVAVAGPLAGGGVCVRITGEGATFDGSRALIEAGTAVSIEADDVVVRHLRASGGERVVHVKGSRATLFDAAIAEGKVGIHVERAADFRVVRSRIEKVAIGIAFDEVPSTTCSADDRQRSPGAVLQRVEITGTGVGIAACEAAPVVIDSTITGNATGWLQGAAPVPENARMKASGPYDPCVCDPTLEGVGPGTTLLYSSGCSGSKYHEGLLPEVREQGHDVNLRLYGRENAAASKVYDAYVRRCAPEITDAIGIPGCMPNYACIADGRVAKRRGDDDRLVVDHRLGSADDVAQFAARCVSAAAAHYGDGRCQTQPMRGTTLCGNETNLIAKRPMSGVGNTCDGIDGVDCRPCGASPTPTEVPANPVPAKAAPVRPAPVEAAPVKPAPVKPAAEGAATPTLEGVGGEAPATGSPDGATAGRPDDRAPGGSSAWWFPLIGLPLGAGLGVFFARR